MPFAVRIADRLVGTTRFADFLPALPAAEIGWTWLDSEQHGSGLNGNIKYLMLRHAFEQWQLVRVQLKTPRPISDPRRPSRSWARFAKACCVIIAGWRMAGSTTP